ncbi:MAG: NOP5/NOP56 family protein [Candidatus Syntropharchaeia archaeon]
MFLITKWFGVFLHDGEGIVEYRLFPKDEKEIAKRLLIIEEGGVLDEERELSRGRDVNVVEERLSKIGKYTPRYELSLRIMASDFGFDMDILRKAQIIAVEEKVKRELGREDLQVIQMVKSVEELTKILNVLSERINEWKNLPVQDKSIRYLNELKRKVDATIDDLRERLGEKMKMLAPNLSELIGPLLAAKLISVTGGIENLAKLPSSSIQILGAEKALFRYKQGKGTPPKHGILFRHPAVRSAKAKDRGKISRVLASKISLAAKADSFTGNFIADKLKRDFEKFVNSIKK